MCLLYIHRLAHNCWEYLAIFVFRRIKWTNCTGFVLKILARVHLSRIVCNQLDRLHLSGKWTNIQFAGVSTGSCRIVGFYEQSSCFVELIWSENNEINENTAEHTIDRKMLVCAHLAAIDDQLHTMGWKWKPATKRQLSRTCVRF